MALKVAVQQSKYKTQFKQTTAEQKDRYYRSNACLNQWVLRSVLKTETESIFNISVYLEHISEVRYVIFKDLFLSFLLAGHLRPQNVVL